MTARLYPFGRNGGQRVDTARRFQPTTTSELLPLPEPLVRAPRIPRNHQPVHQRRTPITMERFPVSRPWFPSRCIEFVRVFMQYRRHHPTRYAARIARDIAFRNLPF